MSLFGRLLIGFALAVLATVVSQSVFFFADPNLRLVPRLMLADRRMVRDQGQRALEALSKGDRNGAERELNAVEEGGLRAWLVTSESAIGSLPADPVEIEKGREALRTGQEFRSIGTRIYLLTSSERRAAFVLSQRPILTIGVLLRALALLAVPVAACLALSKWVAAPIVHLRDAAIRVAKGDLSARVGPISGHREAQELASAFDAMASHVEELVTRQQRMLADVSHEVRSPLARLRLATEMIQSGHGSTTQNLGRLKRDIDRLDELIEALSVVVTTEHGQIKRERIRLHEVVSDIVDGMTPFADIRGIEIRTQVVPIEIDGDPRLIVSAIENVLRNAIHYSPTGGTVLVELSSSPVTLSVSDEGPGVAVELLEQIFEPFFRISESRDRREGGFGLGLAIVRQSVVRHGGSVRANNHPERGLVVTIQLPSVVSDRANSAPA